MMDHYILDEAGEPAAVDLMTWSEWFEKGGREGRVVLQEHPARGVFVSTVFLGLDHSFRFDGRRHPPVLWETMIFGGPFDQFQERYTSRLDALRGHALALALVELYQNVPRKTKQALKKWGGGYGSSSPTIQPGERHRLRRALLRVGWD